MSPSIAEGGPHPGVRIHGASPDRKGCPAVGANLPPEVAS